MEAKIKNVLDHLDIKNLKKELFWESIYLVIFTKISFYFIVKRTLLLGEQGLTWQMNTFPVVVALKPKH